MDTHKKYPDEYERERCELYGGKPCDNRCPLWDDCPREEFDKAQHVFCKRVMDIAKEEKE